MSEELRKVDQEMLSHLAPLYKVGRSMGADTYFCYVNKYMKDAAAYNRLDKVKAWVERNGGRFARLDGDMFTVGDSKGFAVRIVFPTYGKRDMKNIMATLYYRKDEQI